MGPSGDSPFFPGVWLTSASSQGGSSMQTHGRVLILASTDANRRRWSADLDQLGYKTAGVVAADEALRLLEFSGERFSAVLLDAGLPRWTREDLLIRLKTSGQLADLAVIMVGGELEELQRHLDLGVDDYVLEP